MMYPDGPNWPCARPADGLNQLVYRLFEPGFLNVATLRFKNERIKTVNNEEQLDEFLNDLQSNRTLFDFVEELWESSKRSQMLSNLFQLNRTQWWLNDLQPQLSEGPGMRLNEGYESFSNGVL